MDRSTMYGLSSILFLLATVFPGTLSQSSPTVTAAQTFYTGTTGNSITLQCSAAASNANPVTSISWKKVSGGTTTFLTVGTTGKFTGATTADPSLVISSLATTDSAAYFCVAANNIGSTESPQITLSVTTTVAPVTSVGSTSYSTVVGNSILLVCSATNAPTFISWTRNVGAGTQSIVVNGLDYSGATTGNPSLTVIVVATGDTGTYTCTAGNAGGSSSASTTLTVNPAPPSITIAQASYNVGTGIPVTLQCFVTATPSITSLVWTRNGVTITIDNNKYQNGNTGIPSLTITNSQPSDNGAYICSATNAGGTVSGTSITLTVTTIAPVTSVGSTSYTTVVGNSIMLVCSATNAPTAISWTRNVGAGTQSIAVNGLDYSGATTGNPSLTVIVVATGDTGTYTCTAGNAAGSSSASTTLTVNQAPPSITIVQTAYTVGTGTTVTLQCSVTATPSITSLVWTRNGVTITIDNSKYQNGNTGIPSLTITNTQTSDNGAYICRATNAGGTVSGTSITLTVATLAPVTSVGSTSYTTVVGNSIMLVCSATNAPTAISWTRNVGAGIQSIAVNGLDYSGATTGNPSLTVIVVATGDAGTYTCTTGNVAGSSSASTTLTVNQAPPSITIVQTAYTVGTGTTVTLQCSVTATPSITSLVWTRNGVTITIDNSKYQNGNTGIPSLTITNAQTSDNGAYICRATNAGGTVSGTSITLTVTTASASIPSVTIAQTAFGAQVSTTITLGCTVSSTVAVTNVFWTRDLNNGAGFVSVPINGVDFSGSSPSNPALTIINADVTDTGNYICHAVNSAGTGNSATASVTISSPAPTVAITQSQYTVTTGNSVLLQCTVSSPTAVTAVFWQRTISGSTITLTIDNINYSGVTTSAPSLTVINADPGDTGSYVCFATNTAGTGQSTATQLTVSGGAPSVSVSQTSYSTTVGNTITLGCVVNSNPALTGLSWTRNVGSGLQSVVVNGIDYSGGTTSIPSLTVITVVIGDTGSYTCSATNSLGTASATTTLTVSGTTPTATISQSAFGFTTGTTGVIPCTVTGNPAVTSVSWQKTANGATTTLTINNSKYGGSTPSSPSLIIFNAASTDNGVYICIATNSIGSGQSSQASVTVSGNVPAVSIAQATYTVTTGQAVTLSCTVSATPTHTSVVWRRILGGVTTVITIDNSKYQGGSVANPSLTITNAAASDQASYTCSATNTVGTGNSGQTALTVTGNVPIVTAPQVSYTITTGTSVSLTCSVSANPTHNSVFWQFTPTGGATTSVVIDGANYGGASTVSPSLTVFNANSGDQGIYVCFASNTVGLGQSAQVSLTVTGTLPVVTSTQTSHSSITGQTITLQCSVSATPAYTSVFWQRTDNGQTTSVNINGVKYQGGSLSNPSLIITSLTSSDTSVYRCSAINTVGTGIGPSIFLSVTGSLPIVTIAQSFYSVVTGQTITLGCTVTATPGHTSVTWRRIDSGGISSVITIDGTKYQGGSLNNPSLIITSTTPADSFIYTCSAANAVGSGTSGQTTLTVSGSLPIVTISQTAYSVITGQTITLGCTVSATPGHTSVLWQRFVGGVLSAIAIDGSKYQQGSVNNPSLIITNAAASDQTTYTCSATNTVGTATSAQTTLTVSGSLPIVTIAQNAYSVITGQTITLGCTVTATPGHNSVTWRRIESGGSTSIITIDGSKYQQASVNNPSLIITNAGASDAKTYTCSATNLVGTGTSGQTTLTVTGSLPIVTIAQNAYSVITGQTITLGCTVTATPGHNSVTWRRIESGGSTSIITIDGSKYQQASVNNPSLIITNAAASDAKTYTCSATNLVGTGTSGQTTLTVTGSLPVVTIAQNAYSVITGQTITLGCTVTATPGHNSVTWRRIESGGSTSVITIDGSKYQQASVNNPSLIITNAAASDAKTYTCSATNLVGTGTSGQTTLTVTGSLPIVTIAQNAYSVITGQTITLGCTVTATPGHNSVTWRRIESGGSTSVITIDGSKYQQASVNNPSLIITNAAASDAKTYTCSATNLVGTGTSGQTTLTVTGSLPIVTIAQNAYSVITGQTITLGCTVTATPGHNSVTWRRIESGGSTSVITIDGSKYQQASVNNPSLIITNAAASDAKTYTCSATNLVGTGTSGQTTLTVTGSLPIVTIAQNAYSVITGQTITLGCTVTATPGHNSVTWRRIESGGSTSVINIDGSKYQQASVNNPSLIITNAAASDARTYTCSATNLVGTGTSGQTTLTVIGSLPVVTIAQNAYSVITGQTITLGCTVTATPGHNSVTWRRIESGGSTSVITIDGSKYQQASVNNPSLIITNAAASDAKTYTCSATNLVGTGTSGQTTLTVTGSLPIVTIAQNAYSVITGQTITLGCTVTATPGHNSVTWRRIESGGSTSVITIDGSKYQQASVNNPSLIITNAAASDAKTYTCSATNLVGTGTSGQTTLTVTGSLPIVTIAQNAYSVITGQTITLGCTVTATPGHNSVTWRRIESGGSTSVINIDGSKYQQASVNNPSLIITNAAASDARTYTCSATNLVGTGTSGQTTLTVIGSLPVVTIAQNAYSVITGQTITLGCTVTATPGHNSVTWRRIESGGSTSIITIDGSKYQQASVNNPSLIITNAAASDARTYTCSATNLVGTGTSGQTTLTVTGSLPIVTIAQNAYSVITGQTITLGCTVTATPGHNSVTWRRIESGGSTSIITIDGSKYQQASVNNPSLIITNTAASDAKTYTCSATNLVGTGTSGQTTLTVTGSLPIVTIAQNAYSVITGQTITLGCTVTATPGHNSVTWRRIESGGSTSVITIDGSKYQQASVNNPSLIITNAAASDAKTYTCSATNLVGTGTSGQTTLTVTGSLPIVTIAQNAYSVITGQTIALGCTVTATPGHNSVTWRRIESGGSTSVINIDGSKYQQASVNNPSLIITNAAASDAKTYTCSATNLVGTGTSGQTTLTVTGSLPIVTIAQNAYSVITGQTITLGCTVTATPGHNSVTWRRIESGGSTSVINIDGSKYQQASVNNPSLIITNAAASDAKTYTCSATNLVGTGTSGQTTLTVTGSLPIVTIAQNAYSVITGQTITLGCTVTATPGHNSVTWRRIESGGSTSVINIDGSKYQQASVNNPSLIITNAAASDAKTYTCSATNLVGTGTSGQTTLTVTGSLPIVTIAQNAYSVITGQTITLGCTVTATPGHNSVTWRRIESGGSTSVINIDGSKYQQASVNNPSLIITNAASSDAKTYTCSATNLVGTGTSGQTTLTVTGSLPIVTIAQNAYSVITGQTITLGCTVTATPGHNSVTWRRIESGGSTSVINIDGSKYQQASVNNPSLIITNAAATDAKTYTCSATNLVGTGTSGQTTLTVAGSLPVVTIAQNAYSVITGQTIALGCTVTATPGHNSVTWRRIESGGSTSVITIDGSKYQQASVNNPSLIITNAAARDAKTYTCSATNLVGTGTSGQTTLTVTGSLPIVTIAQNAYSVITGQTITLGCTVTATPGHNSVTWRRIESGGSTSVINIDGSKYQQASVNNPSLIITNAAASDAKTYTCSATNLVGTGTSGQTTLTITGSLPIVTIAQNAYSVITGQTITLGCTVTATPGHNSVTWRRIESGGSTSVINIDGSKYQQASVNNPSLIITNAAASDAKTYTCSATNLVGTGTSGQTTLTVSGSVPVVTVSQSAYSVITGQTVTLVCTVTATPAHNTVSWTRIKNGAATTISIDGVKYQGSAVNTPSLTITLAAQSDQAVYTCSATNLVGTGTSASTSLTVTGSIPVVTVQQTSYSVITGQTAILVCGVTADPGHTSVFWQFIKNGVTSNVVIDGTNYSGTTVNSPTLNVINANSGDEGAYVCFATNLVGTGQSSQTVLSVTGNLPVVVIAQSSYSVVRGQTVTLGCTVSATPGHTSVTWRRIAGTVSTIINIDGTKYQGGSISSPSLTITSAADDDQRTYTCSATNAVGTGTSGTTTLAVTGNIPAVTIGQTSYSVITGQTAVLVCTVSAGPAHNSVYWQVNKNGVITTIAIDGVNYAGSTVSSPTLQVLNANQADQGVYTCYATNIVGTGSSATTVLTVTGSLPVVTIGQTAYSVITGQTITLGCTVTATPGHNSVTWRRIDGGVANIITIDGSKYQQASVNNPSLIITNAAASDAKTYTCSASNLVGASTSAQTTLTVTGAIPTVTVAQTSYSVITGQTATLVCTVAASPSHSNVFWQRIVNGQAQSIAIDGTNYGGAEVNSPSLIVYNANNADQGPYICYATNIVGTGQSSQTVFTVTGTVPVVSIAQAQYTVITGQSINLVCTVSANPAHSSVTWYSITNGVSSTININGVKYIGATISNPTLTITNAAASDQKIYTCTATNLVGTGTSGQTTLTITGAIPTVTVAQTSYSVVTGQTTTLVCTVAASPSHNNVFWQRIVNGQAQSIAIDGTNYGGAEVNSPSLIVYNANNADQGPYICYATNIVGTGQSSQTVLMVTGSLPVVTIAQASYSVVTGQPIALGCTVTASPSHTQVIWQSYVNGVPSTISIDGNKYAGATLASPSLTIFNAVAGDGKIYTCSATNAVGTGTSAQTTLIVTGALPTVTIASTSYTVTQGQTTTLGCSVTSDPAHTSVFWTRIVNGQTQTITIDGSKYVGSTINSPNLVILNAQDTDEGVYTCYAINIVGTGQSAQTVLAVTGNIPVVTVPLTQVSVVTGQDITIQCTVTADPAHSAVFWERTIGGNTIQLNIDNVNYGGSTVSSPHLIIYTTNSADIGVYVCKATNTVGTGQSAQVQLTVTGTAPSVTVAQATYSVLTGSTVTLTCTITASPSHTSVQWLRVVNGVNQAITIGSSGKYAGSTISVPSLTINGAQASDNGQYICTAANLVGTGQSSTTVLTVTGNLPVVTIAQTSYSVVTGTSATLVCTVTANPAATTVMWRRLVGGTSNPITIDNSKYLGGVIGNPSITITNTQSSDEGFYICQAANVVGTGESATTYLAVTGAAPVVTISQNVYSVQLGSSTTIDCTVSATPSHSLVRWQKTTNTGGTSVTTDVVIDGINFSGGSLTNPSLSVITVRQADEGFYVCSATNMVGTGTSQQAFLDVTGAVPTVTVAQTSYTVVTGASVTLQCTAFGNPAVGSIGWTFSLNSGTFDPVNIDGSSYTGGTITNPSLTVFNADANDAGVYICRASNAIGTGQSQQVSLGVTGNAPTVTVSQQTYNVITGSPVTLQCAVTAVPAANSVYWEKTSGSTTTRLTIDNVQYAGSSTGSPSLIIYSTNSADDNGVYVCKATNAVGTGQSQQVTVSVTGATPVVVIGAASYTVTTGTTATLGCTVTANPQANTLVWQKTANGVTTTISIDNSKYSGGSVGSPTLVISNAASSDVGFYTCQATNAVGTGTSTQTYLQVTGALPIVQVLQPTYTVTTGQSITLGCSVSGIPAATSVLWKRTSGGVTTDIAIDNSVYQGSSITSPSLVITSANSDHTGSYVCTATNTVGIGRSTTTILTVTGEIPTVNIPQTSYTVITGFAITLTCTVSANPPATTVRWHKRENINSALTEVSIDGTNYVDGSTSIPSLTISSATAADIGFYICSAANSIGTGQSGQTYLTVTGAIPTVTIPSNAYSVITGQSIQIPCTVTASPSASSITWTKIVTPAGGGATVTITLTIDGSKYEGSTIGTPSLTINMANNADQAYYVCNAINSVGPANSIQTYLTVSGSIPVVTLGQAQYSTVLGTSITIDCTVSATPQADSISWERIIGGTTSTLTIDGTKFVGSSVTNPSLTVNTATADDQGFYVCVAINSVGIARSAQGYLTVTGNVPSVVISRPSYTVILGNNIVIDCDYSATPDATAIRWEKIVNTQTTTIAVTSTNKYSGATLTNPSLTITGTSTDDQAFYRCVVANTVGEGQSNQVYLYVTGNLPAVNIPVNSYSVSLENTITLVCSVTATPSATTVMWQYTDSNGIITTVDLSNSRYTGGTVGSPSLVISSARLGDQGSYRCKATNTIGEGASSLVFLYVTGTLPSVRVTVSAYTVDIGATATLACIVEASPAATSVYWTKIVNGAVSTISTTLAKYSGSAVDSPSLIINNLVVGDEGSYRCNAINTVGTGQSGLTSLIVAYAPRSTVVNPAAVTRREGESMTSECFTDANPAASFQWVKDNTNQVVSNEKVLQISNIDRGHDGTYTCTATNSQGLGSAQLTMDVQYKPISTVTQEERTVILSLNAQRNLECNTVANPAVQTYRWLKDGNAIPGAESLVYTVTIGNSNNYGSYTCYATNTIGQSSGIIYTVQPGDAVVTTVAPPMEELTAGLIIAIVISAVVLLLIIIIIVCCCVTHGVCRTDERLETKRIIVEKPSLHLRESPIIMPRTEVMALPEEGFYRNPAAQYRYLPQLEYTYYESEGSKRDRDRRSYTSSASVH